MQLTRRAPAKINLFLRVGGRGDDGFHPLLSWMCTVGLFDTLRFQFDFDKAPAAASPRATLGRARNVELSLASDDPRLPTDARNLVWRAMKAIVEARGLAGTQSAGAETASRASGPTKPLDDGTVAPVEFVPGQADAMSPAGGTADGEHGETSPADRDVGAVSAFLEKRIPAGAGLGGGSSDAATTLAAVNALLDAGLTRDELSKLAAKIGSDVPFFLHGPSAMCAGRGEVVRPIAPPARAGWALLILPEIEMPTPAVYQKFDEMLAGDPALTATAPAETVAAGVSEWQPRSAMPAEQLLPLLVNDLERPAFALRPDLGALRSEIEQTLGRIVRMSGSGSALFTLFDDEPAAHRATRLVAQNHAVPASVVVIAPRLDNDH